MNIAKISTIAISTGMALVTATGIALNIRSCTRKPIDGKDNARVEIISYDGCRTPQDKLLCSVELALGKENPFTTKIIQNKGTHELFLELTGKTGKYSIESLKKYTIANIKTNLGILDNVIGQYNSPREATGRRNWSNDKATIDAGKSIKIPLRSLGIKETENNRNNIYELRKNVVDIYKISAMTFETAKLNIENIIDKYLSNDKNSLKTTLTGRGGQLFARITRTNNDNKNLTMYSMEYIKDRLGLKDYVISNNSQINSINTNEWVDTAILLPRKHVDIPLSELGQSKDTKENEYLKRAAFNIDN